MNQQVVTNALATVIAAGVIGIATGLWNLSDGLQALTTTVTVHEYRINQLEAKE